MSRNATSKKAAEIARRKKLLSSPIEQKKTLHSGLIVALVGKDRNETEIIALSLRSFKQYLGNNEDTLVFAAKIVDRGEVQDVGLGMRKVQYFSAPDLSEWVADNKKIDDYIKNVIRKESSYAIVPGSFGRN